MIFQGASLLLPLSVLENVALPLLLEGRTEKTPSRARTNRSACSTSAALAAKLPEELSGGQAQRVAIARAAGERAAPDARRRADEPARPRPQRRTSSTCCSTPRMPRAPRSWSPRTTPTSPHGSIRAGASPTASSLTERSHAVMVASWLARPGPSPAGAHSGDGGGHRHRRLADCGHRIVPLRHRPPR